MCGFDILWEKTNGCWKELALSLKPKKLLDLLGNQAQEKAQLLNLFIDFMIPNLGKFTLTELT